MILSEIWKLLNHPNLSSSRSTTSGHWDSKSHMEVKCPEVMALVLPPSLEIWGNKIGMLEYLRPYSKDTHKHRFGLKARISRIHYKKRGMQNNFNTMIKLNFPKSPRCNWLTIIVPIGRIMAGMQTNLPKIINFRCTRALITMDWRSRNARAAQTKWRPLVENFSEAIKGLFGEEKSGENIMGLGEAQYGEWHPPSPWVDTQD